MDKLITVKDVSERYGCSLPTARKYIRQCNPHMENPLATTARAFQEWEDERTVYKPLTKSNRIMANIHGKKRVLVPRKREG